MEKKNILNRIDLEIAEHKLRLETHYTEMVEYFATNNVLTVYEGIGYIEELVLRLRGDITVLEELCARRCMIEVVYE